MISRSVNKGEKLRCNDWIDIPGKGRGKVTGIFEKSKGDFTVAVKLNNTIALFDEKEIIKYKLRHLKVVDSE